MTLFGGNIKIDGFRNRFIKDLRMNVDSFINFEDNIDFCEDLEAVYKSLWTITRGSLPGRQNSTKEEPYFNNGCDGSLGKWGPDCCFDFESSCIDKGQYGECGASYISANLK